GCQNRSFLLALKKNSPNGGSILSLMHAIEYATTHNAPPEMLGSLLPVSPVPNRFFYGHFSKSPHNLPIFFSHSFNLSSFKVRKIPSPYVSNPGSQLSFSALNGANSTCFWFSTSPSSESFDNLAVTSGAG